MTCAKITSVFSRLHCVVSDVFLHRSFVENRLLSQNTPVRRGSIRSLATARGSLIQLRAAKKQTGNLTGALHVEKNHHNNTWSLVHLSRRKDYAWWHCIYQGAPHFVHELRIFDLLHVLLPDVSLEVVAGYDWALRWWTRWYHQAGMGQGMVLRNVQWHSWAWWDGYFYIFFSDNYRWQFNNGSITIYFYTYTDTLH